MFKNLTKKLIVVYTLIAIFIVCIGVSFAWFYVGPNEVNLKINSGSFILQYFHTGDGTKDNPFVITRPIHYYHMVELYQRKPEFAEGYLNEENGQPYYFQIGYDLDGDPSNGLEVYNYDDTGAVIKNAYQQDTYSKTLNMAYYSGSLALLPMGTSSVPFIGVLDGSGLTISNLNITATETVGVGADAKHYYTSDVGVFGYIGGEYVDDQYEGGYIHDVYYENVTIDVSGIKQGVDEIKDQNGQVINEALTHIDHADGEVYIGYLVGHLPIIRLNENGFDADSIFNNVYINNCSIIGGDIDGDSAVQYGYIGHLDLLQYPDIQPATIRDIITYIQGTGTGTGGDGSGSGAGGEAGADPGWGGSLDMRNFYDKMLTRKNAADDTSSYTLWQRIAGEHFAHYVTDETVIVENGKVVSRVTNDSEFEGGSYVNALPYRVYNAGIDNFEGSYYFFNSLLDNWICFSSSTEQHTKTVTYYVTSDNAKDALVFYHESNGVGAYLGTDGSHNIVDIASIGYAAFFAWGEEKNDGITQITKNNLYVVDSTTNTQYFLDTDGINVYLTSSTSASSFTSWYTQNDASGERNNHILYTLIGGKKYYLVNGSDVFGGNLGWMVICEDGLVEISAGSQYMTIASGALSNTSNRANSTKWILGNGKLFTFSNGTKYYLTVDGNGFAGITTDANGASSFAFSNNKLTTSFDGSTCVLTYGGDLFGVNKWIAVKQNAVYTIKDGNNYLLLSGSTVSANTSSYTNWVFTNNKIYTYNGSGRVFLAVDGNGFIGTTTSSSGATSFSFNASNITTTFENASCEMVYDTYFGTSRWMVVSQNLQLYKIGDGTNYLCNGNGSITTKTSNATNWVLSGDGKLYSYNGTNRNYLYIGANGVATISTSSSTIFSVSSTKITTTFENGTCVLLYDNTLFKTNNWLVVPENSLYKISNGSVYLNLDSSHNISTTSTASTVWVKANNGALYTYISSTRYYLNANADGILIVGTSGSTTYSVSSTQITTSFDSGKTYYLTYANYADLNCWMVAPSTVTSIDDGSNSLGYYRNLWFYNGEKVWTYTYNSSAPTDRTQWHRAFLLVSGSAVGVTSDYAGAASFSYDSSKFYTANGNLVYGKAIFGNSCGYDWMILPSGQKITVNYGSNYLNIATTTSGDTTVPYLYTTSSVVTGLYMSGGQIYTYLNGTQYYLGCSEIVTVSTTANSNWSVSSGNLYYSGSKVYYNSSVANVYQWSTVPSAYVIRDDLGNYISSNGSGFGATTSLSSALLFVVSGKTARLLGTTSYMNEKDGSGYQAVIGTESESFSNMSTSKISFRAWAQEHFLCWNYNSSGTWSFRLSKNINTNQRAKLVEVTYTNVATATLTNLSLSHKTNLTVSKSSGNTVSASLAKGIAQGSGGSLASRAMYTQVTVSAVDPNTPFCTYSYTTKIESRQKYDGSGNPVYDGSGNPVMEDVEVIDKETCLITLIDGKISNDIRVQIEDSTNYTYIPIMTKTTNEIDNDLTSEYSASHNNTGYIVSGVHEGGTDISNSDIRVSSYSISNIRNSLNTSNTTITEDDDKNLEILTRDPVTGEYCRITDATIVNSAGETVSSHNSTNGNPSSAFSSLATKTVKELGLLGYQDLEGYYNTVTKQIEYRQFARDNLYNMLSGSSSVYALRFMNETISADNTIMAKNVRLLNTDYDYYEMPISCVDFKVQSAGRISFFAGQWSTVETSDAFFSLHRIFRDSDNNISAIKEIRKIYKGMSGYLYQFADGTFYDGSVFYAGTGTAPIAYYPNLVFDMEWIAPTDTSLSLVSNAIYYFEIPVGAGEYALGSVDGHNGAYLLYLDVGANSSTPNVPTEEEEDVPVETRTPKANISTDAVFSNLDYRVIGQVCDIDEQGRHRSILTFNFGIPTDATETNFSVDVKYQGEFEAGEEPQEGDEYYDLDIKNRSDYYEITREAMQLDGSTITEVIGEGIGTWCRGVYQIYVKNNTSSQFVLSVLLTDNDGDLYNEFPYAYEILVYDNNPSSATYGEYVASRNIETVSGVARYSGTLRRWSRNYLISADGTVSPME